MNPILTFDGCKLSRTYYSVPQPIGRNVPMHTEINVKPPLPTSPINNGNWGKTNHTQPDVPQTGKN